ncbi:FMN-binding protein [Agromyces sp. NPDC057865]|uniref:FMN-binding protein n=1 Tax=Agromyces sp. NPDC057865 TaxID=3346267 RepID=UPI00366E3BB2
MRRRAVILASAASATAILGGWQLGLLGTPSAPVAETTTQTVGGSSGGAGGSGSSGSGTGGSGSTDAATSAPSTGSGTDASSGTSTDSGTSGAAAAASADGTYSGSSVGTRFGDVQVQVTISGGAITDVTALHLTDHDGRSVSISNRAEPILRDEVLQAQSSSVSLVSGATYTSAAYLQSLQAALDAAGF